MELTARGEDYLKTIYKLLKERKVVRVKDLSVIMEVRAPTVVGILTSLKAKGYVQQEPYGYLTLTEEGSTVASQLVEKEVSIRDFLREVLGLREEEAENNACAMEHYISPVCLERFLAFIRFVDLCEWGRPRWLEQFRLFVETGQSRPCTCEHRKEGCDGPNRGSGS
ncbi:MAG: metal-dependent transcriptional regulator [Synergistales bacterium]|jgi:DtxR family Mn-dependent transcriptional regulator